MNANKGDRLYFDPELISVSESIPIAKIQDAWEYDHSDFDREFEDSSQSEPELDSKVIPHDIRLQIKDVSENIPIVLKKPVSPEQGRTVFKSGIKTGVTEGEILATDGTATVKPETRTLYLKNQFRTNKMGEKGDSGSYVLTKDTYEPIGLFSAIDENTTFHTKLIDICKSVNAIGFYAPISLPPNTPITFEELLSTIIPNGIFQQHSALINKDWREIAQEIGVPPDQFESDPIRSDRYLTLDIPDEIGDAGSVWSTKEGEVVGLQIGGSGDMSFVMPIECVLNALNLELITGLNSKSRVVLKRAGYWKLRCQECQSIMSPNRGCYFCNS